MQNNTNQELGETTGVYVIFNAGTGGHFVAAMLDMIRNPNRKTLIDSENGHCKFYPGQSKPLHLDGITAKNSDPGLFLSLIDNFILDPIEYDFYIIATNPGKTQGILQSIVQPIFTNTKIIRIYIDPQDDMLLAQNRYAKHLVDQYINNMTSEVYSEHLYNPDWELHPHHRYTEVTYKKTLIKLGYSTVIDPRSVDVATYLYILDNWYYDPTSLRKIPDQENMLQINVKDLITRKYNVIDEIATLMSKSLTSEHLEKLCDYMDEYADKQSTYEKMKEKYNYEQSKDIIIYNEELGETTGVYVFYDCGAGGNFVAAMLDMIRNPNRKTTIDSENGHCHVEKLFTEGVTNKDFTLNAINPSNFILHPIDYDFYIIAAHLGKHNATNNPKSIFTHTKIIRVFTEPENFFIIAKNIYAKLLITQYDENMTSEIYSEHLYNPGWEKHPEHEWLEVLYKKTLIELGYSTVINPRSVDVETYNKIIHTIIEVTTCCVRKIPDQENMLQINMKDLITRKYNVIDEIATLMSKSLTSEHRQKLCYYMDEYADKHPTYEKMKEKYNYEQSSIR